MQKDAEHKTPRPPFGRVWKWLLVPLVLLLLFGAVRWLLQSDRLLDMTRERIEREAGKHLNGDLAIGRLSGDLLYGIRAEAITLDDGDGERLLSLDSLRVDYTVPGLIRGLTVDRVKLDGLSLHERETQGQWRLQTLFPERAEPVDVEEVVAALPSFAIRSIELNNGSVEAHSERFPDEFLAVRQMALRASASHGDEGWQISLGDLRFLLEEGRLPRPVELGASARMEDEEITLNRLVVGTGRSFLDSHARGVPGGEWRADLRVDPLSYEDLDAYGLKRLKQDLTLTVEADGRADRLNLQLYVGGRGLEELNLGVSIDWTESISIRDLELAVRNLDGPLLTGDEQMPVIGSFRLSSTGEVFPADPDEMNLSGQAELRDLQIAGRSIERTDLDFRWEDRRISLDLGVDHRGEQFLARAILEDPLGDRPVWSVNAEAEELNLAQLLEDPALESSLNLSARFSGGGFEPGHEPFSASLDFRESRWGDQLLNRVTADGELTDERADLLIEAVLGDGRLQADLHLEEWMEQMPRYTFDLDLVGFDLADLHGVEGVRSNLNAQVRGEGRGFDADLVEMRARLAFDESELNGEPIEALEAEMELEGPRLTVSRAVLESPFADIRFAFRQNLADIRDPANWLEMDGEFKETGLLAPLIGVQQLDMPGRFHARVEQTDGAGAPRLDGGLELQDVAYDSLLTLERLEASIQGEWGDIPRLDYQLQADSPVAAGIGMEQLSAEGDLYLEELNQRGEVAFTLDQDEAHRISYRGDYLRSEDRFTLTTDRFRIEAGERVMSLNEPFGLFLEEGGLRMEPVRLVSAIDQTWLTLEIPRLDADRQQFLAELEELHVGPLQQMLLGETYAEGRLSGRFQMDREPDRLEADLSLRLAEAQYMDGRMDLVEIDAGISEERLQLSFDSWLNGERMAGARADLPFLPGDPEEFDENFFEQPVSGELELVDAEVGLWTGFLPAVDNLGLEGRIGLQAELGGTAGQPFMEGRFQFDDGRLSGVRVDRFTLDFDYRHQESLVRLQGDLHSLDSEIARYRADLPLYLDMRSFDINLPSSEDEVFAEVQTDQFNLGLLNDFLDPELMRDLRGHVSGRFELQGPIADPRPHGSLELRGGNLRIVPTGINLSEITSDLQIRPGRMELQNLVIRSGPGRFTARGTMGLDGLEPGEFDLDLRAVQFRAANTPEMNAIVDLTSRLRGDAEAPVLTGNLRFRSGFVMLQNFGEQAIEDVRLEDEDPDDPFEFYNNLSMEMNVGFDRQFFIRNRQYLDLEVELSGDVDLVKQRGGDLELFGAMEGLRGYARPLGRHFDLEEAQVIFSGPPENPDLQIRTRFEPRRGDDDVIIWYVIAGTVQEPEFRFESEPFLELQDMISYTLFGQPFYALDSWQQAVSGGGGDGTAADVAMDLLIDRVGMLAARQLGIDVVEIDTYRSGGSNNTTIKTGWYLSDRAFFAVLNEISGTSPKTLFMLEYMLRRNLELVVTQGDDSREGIDLRWRFDY